MHTYRSEILKAIEKYTADHNIAVAEDGFRYLGTTKPFYYIKAADLRKIYKDFAIRHPDLNYEELVALLDSLSLGKTNNEFSAIGLLLEAYPKLRGRLDPNCLDSWLDHAEGWAEVDVICQFNFTANEMLADWERWEALLSRFTESENIHKRRACLVLLTKSLRESDDPRLAKRAFANTDRLKGEKNILITKAISWILRSLIKFHREEVEQYLEANASTLPKIALREVRYKLLGGVKKKMSKK